MEILLLAFIPILFLTLGGAMMAVSQVSGFFTFRRYSLRQRYSNRIIARFIRNMAGVQAQLARRSEELERLSANLAATNQDLERLNTLKSRFLSMAVHDVRTPLATIKGYAELLSERRLRTREAQCVKGIMVASDNIGRLVGDLTDLAVIEAGKLKMDKAAFYVSDLAADIVSTFAPLAANRGVALLASSVPETAAIVGDRFRLGQVISNFLGNALKFTPRGGRVELRIVPSAGGMLFSVADTGPGIHPSERARIFEKFYQSKYSDPAAAKLGWGLGLSISQEIVRAHQGDIGVESAGLGKGSKFWFYVPATPPPPSRRESRVPRRLAALGIALLLLAGALPRAGRAQTLPLDDKARYDKFLEEKAESVLLKMLGPNRSKIVVDATLDFTRTEHFEIVTGAKKVDAPEVGRTSLYAWENVTEKPSGAPSSELLPGIPMEGGGGGIPQSYERRYAYPASFVKRLAVNILLDRSVPKEQASDIQTIVSNLLDVDPNRGDSLNIVWTTFAPAWKTVWYSQDSFSMVFRYAMLSIITLIILVVVAVCFLRLAGAMEAMARAQGQQYASDIGMREEAPGLPAPGASEAAAKSEEEGGERHADLTIQVRPEQVPNLVEMLKAEDPDNIALVAAYLDPAMRNQFLAELPGEVGGEVILRLSQVKFVEEELIAKIKEEVERRLAGAVGGLSSVYDIIERAAPGVQREILRQLELKDPEVYRRVRARVLVMEDLLSLSADEWSFVIGRTRLNDWACALKSAQAKLRDTVQQYVQPETWKIMGQMMEVSAATPDQVTESESAILKVVRELVSEGRIQSLARGGAPA